MNGIRAAVTAKAEALRDLNPRVFAAVLIAGGVLLVMSGLGSTRQDGHDGQEG